MTIEEQIEAAERELSMRKRVYPNWVKLGRMSGFKADDEIAAMEAIIETLKHVRTKRQGDLFDK